MRAEVLELGRACVHTEYRNTLVLHMLWKGIARYAINCSARYLLGCSSINSQDEAEGLALYEQLKEKYLAALALRTEPRPAYSCCPKREPGAPAQTRKLPGLFRAYLDVSARLCGPPSIDRAFRTIDFLTVIDLKNIPDRVRVRFF